MASLAAQPIIELQNSTTSWKTADLKMLSSTQKLLHCHSPSKGSCLALNTHAQLEVSLTGVKKIHFKNKVNGH
jgi:hypothetical protein